MRRFAVWLWAATLLFGQQAGIPEPEKQQVNPPGSKGRATTPANSPAGGAGRGASAAGGRGASAPPASGLTSARELKFPALRVLQEPPTSTLTLSNGLKVFLEEDHDLPVVGGIAMVKTGTLLDPPQRIGLAELAVITLRTGGTNLKTPEQVDALLDDNAINLESKVTDSMATVTFSAMKDNAGIAFQLFKEFLAQPGFRQEKLEMAKSQIRQAISHRNDVVRTLAHREFNSLIYGAETPYGWQPEYGTLDPIRRADVREFHQRYFSPANTTLGIWGDFNSETMKAELEKVFGAWKAAQPAAAVDFGKIRIAAAPGVFLAERKDTQPSSFSIGHLGGLKSDKDYPALQVMAAILGGGPQSRIVERLRRAGITNDVGAVWNAGYLQPGLFEVSGTAKPTATIETVRAIQDEIGKIRTAEVTDDECRVGREAVIHSLIFAHDTRAKLFAGQLALDYYGYPKDYLSRHQKALQAVSKADVLRVAKQYLKPADLSIVVSGNPTMFVEPLEKLGKVTKLDTTIPEPKPEVAETTEASLAQGKQILMRAQQAAGGTEKLAAVNDYTMLSDYAIDPAVSNIGGFKIAQTDRWIKPASLRQDSILPAGRVSAYTDGKVGWISTPQGWGALSAVQRSQIAGDLFRVYFRLLLSDRIDGRTVNAIEDNTVQITDTTGQMSTVEFDEQTHLPKRVSYDTQQAGGAPIYSEDVYEDFRDVGGILMPFKITINQAGRRFSDVAVKDYKLNSGINPTELGRRPQ